VHLQLLVLRQVIRDGEPWRLGADENMLGRTNARIVDESSHGHVDERAGADQRVELFQGLSRATSG
jgi:hypothetical protein